METAAKNQGKKACVWLVDMGYVVKAGKVSNLRLDYGAAARFIGRRFGPFRGFLFNSIDNHYGVPAGLQSFYMAMEKQGFTVRLHEMTGMAQRGNHRQSRVDVDLACHAVWQASLPDVGTLLLTSGDQDMIPAVEMIKRLYGKRVVLLTFGNAVSEDLAAVVDEQFFIEAHSGELTMR